MCCSISCAFAINEVPLCMRVVRRVVVRACVRAAVVRACPCARPCAYVCWVRMHPRMLLQVPCARDHRGCGPRHRCGLVVPRHARVRDAHWPAAVVRLSVGGCCRPAIARCGFAALLSEASPDFQRLRSRPPPTCTHTRTHAHTRTHTHARTHTLTHSLTHTGLP